MSENEDKKTLEERHTNQEADQSEIQKRPSKRDTLTFVAAFGSFVVSVFALVFTAKQAVDSRSAAVAADRAAAEAKASTERALKLAAELSASNKRLADATEASARTAEGMLEAAKSALAVADRSVRASEKSAETARLATAFIKNIEIPNVKVVRAGPLPSPLSLGKNVVPVFFKNVGRSAALRVSAFASLQMTPAPLSYAVRRIPIESPKIALAPGEEMQFPALSHDYSAADIAEIDRLKKVPGLGGALSIEAYVEYDDSSGNHYFKAFCMRPLGDNWFACGSGVGKPPGALGAPRDYETRASEAPQSKPE